ncbi:MAG: hypothetical protein ACYDC9_08010 [Dermatophilaceae bacterium]
MDSAHPIPAPVVPAPVVPAPVVLAPVVPGAGRHRRPGLPVAVALRGVRVRSRQLALLGVLVLLVAAAMVLGARGSGALSSAQPRAGDAAAYSGLSGR